MTTKRAFAVLLLILIIAVSFAPAALNSHGNAAATQTFSFSSTIPFSGNGTVTVFIPSNESYLQGIFKSYLNGYGIEAKTFGSLMNFNLPVSNSNGFMSGFSSLSDKFHVNYFVSNNSANFVPFLSYGNITGSQSGVPFAYSPTDIANAYNFKWAETNNLTGKGTTITIIDAFGDPNIQYDVRAFDNRTSLPPIKLTVMYPTGPVNSYNKSWAIETSTDVEWAHAMAPGANIVLMVSQNANTTSLEDAVSYAVSNHIGSIMSLSWGISENQLGNSEIATLAGVYRDAANEGITVLAATGDNGAYDGTSSLTVNFPSSDPFVTAVGGTSLFSTAGAFSERAWGGILNGKSYGSGGGYSSFFPRPYWQNAPGLNGTQRGTPDVSLDANPDTGMIVISQGKEYKVGGTSIATPIWADVIALVSQYVGQDLGFMTPMLYQISTSSLYSSAFYDITAGTNGHYSAGPGWDPVTGLGTPNVEYIAKAAKGILSPYGAMAVANGTNAYAINATLEINGNPALENFNGSSFYYLALYSNSSNFVKFGVEASNSTLSYKYIVEQNGTSIEHSSTIGAFENKDYVFPLNLSFSGNNITMQSGKYSATLNQFLTFIGSAQVSFGAEQTDSLTNLTQMPPATFSDVNITTASGSEAPPYISEIHYQGIPGQNTYSTINILPDSGSNSFKVSYGSSQTNGDLIGTSQHSVLYTLSYNTEPTGTFYVGGVSGQLLWSVNGNLISGNTYPFKRAGNYTISAQLGKGGATVSREIYVPNIYSSTISVDSNIIYFQHPEANATVNNFYTYRFTGSTSIPTVYGGNTVYLSSFGFFPKTVSISNSGSASTTLTARNVSVSVFAFPGNALVTVNGGQVSSYRGEHSVNVAPQKIEINVTAAGYKTNTSAVELMPGQNYSTQVIMEPTAKSNYIDGYVTDKEYSFPLYQANVSVKGGPYAYTNNTGFYVVFMPPGKYNLNFSSPLYVPMNETFDITNNSMSVSVALTPNQINVSNIPQITVTKTIPILFFLGFISWTKYTGQNFQYYQIYYSTNKDMSNAAVVSIANQGTTYTMVTGIYPTHTYYITAVIHLTDGQIYSSNEVQMGYSNLIYLVVNLAIVAGILVYLYFAVGFFRRASKRGKN